MEIRLKATVKQMEFIKATADEVLFGGAAGGGKSMGQMIDALIYAMKYAKSRQLILRRTLPELEKTLIRYAAELYPEAIYRYSQSTHTGRFINGSILEFGYCDNESDVHRYQSAEYDVIRFDELTHFTEYIYLYLYSRLRGSNGYPKQIKSTCNPGGPGHDFVKRRFIDLAEPGIPSKIKTGTRIFIPSFLADNCFLTAADPNYRLRLLNLPKREQRALLLGEWELAEGRYFSEWSESAHVCPAFEPPAEWPRYISLDYGLDMLAVCFLADSGERIYVYKEVYKSGLIISAAAREVIAAADGRAVSCFAPSDLWNRRQDTGRSAAEIFAQNGLPLTRISGSRVAGWLALRELLRTEGDGHPRLMVTENCRNLIRSMGAIMCDCAHPGDAAVNPHELTHAPDALRYFAAARFGRSTSTEDAELSNLVSFGI